MQNKTSQKSRKPLGFLSVVTFLMIMVGVGYTVSNAVAQSPNSALSPVLAEDQITGTSSNISPQSQGGSLLSSLESSVANKATTFWQSIIGNAVSTESVSIDTDNSTQNEKNSTFSSDLNVSLAPTLPLPGVYGDITSSKYRDAILVLYSQGLLLRDDNFHPDNFVRVSDFIRVVMDAYLVQQGIDPLTQKDYSTKTYFVDEKIPTEVLVRVNRAFEAGFLQNLDVLDENGKSRLTEFISPSKAQGILRLMSAKSPSIVQNPPDLAFQSKTMLRKDEMAKLVVDSLNMKLNSRSLPVFKDIYGSKYQEAIQMLADYGIVGGVNGNFFPDAGLENKDFVIMLSRVLLLQQNKTFVPIDRFYYLTTIKNVSNLAPYAPYLEFCLEYEICNSLLSQESTGVGFSANKQLLFSEITPVFSSLNGGQFILPYVGENRIITRGETANLLLQVIQSSSKSENAQIKEEKKTDSPARRTKFQEFMKVS